MRAGVVPQRGNTGFAVGDLAILGNTAEFGCGHGSRTLYLRLMRPTWFVYPFHSAAKSPSGPSLSIGPEPDEACPVRCRPSHLHSKSQPRWFSVTRLSALETLPTFPKFGARRGIEPHPVCCPVRAAVTRFPTLHRVTGLSPASGSTALSVLPQLTALATPRHLRRSSVELCGHISKW